MVGTPGIGQRIVERRIDWSQFRAYFQDKYLTTWYYDNKRKEFHELKPGHKSMEENVHKFIEILRYVNYIREESVKI